MLRYLVFCLFIIGSTGCIYYPKTVTVYDKECDIEVKKMELREDQLQILGKCENEQCIYSVITAGAASAATGIISGTVVVTGNVVYWFEKQKYCHVVSEK